jgi:azurin|tara:strand:- start:2097 stop:2645 length:549 start_codon:yes stop_codon:yes gene_type:complete
MLNYLQHLTERTINTNYCDRPAVWKSKLMNRIKSYLTIISTLLCFGINSVKAQECTLEIRVGDNLTFTPPQLSISKSKCPTVRLNLTHLGNLPRNGMGHNWALTLTENAQSVAQAGWQSGLENQYMPLDDERVIATTDIIGGGESVSVAFASSLLDANEDYTFFCSFVGHFSLMKGIFTVNE